MRIRIENLTSWMEAYHAALFTEGKDVYKEPSDEWKRKMLNAEHSPIRVKMYRINLYDIPFTFVSHITRHKFGVEFFVTSSRPDRGGKPREEQKKTDLTNISIVCNAQALITISRFRLCNKAEEKTREIWEYVKMNMKLLDPIMAEFMIPNCKYFGKCKELKPCGNGTKTCNSI